MSWYQPRFQKDPYGNQHKLYYFLKKSTTDTTDTTETNEVSKRKLTKDVNKKKTTVKSPTKPLKKPAISKQKNTSKNKKTCPKKACPKNTKNIKEPKTTASDPECPNSQQITKDNFI